MSCQHFTQVRVTEAEILHFWCVLTPGDQRHSWFLKVFSHVHVDHCQNLPELRENGAEKRYCLGRPLIKRYSSCLLQRHTEKTRKVKYALLIILYSPILTLIDEFFLKQEWHFPLHGTILPTLVTTTVTALHQRSVLVLCNRAKSYQREPGWHT